MEKKEYLVLGATGKTGRRVVNQLRDRGEIVRAARSPEVPFDWNDPQTWQPALEGVYGVYMVVPVDENSVETTERFVAAMEKAEVRRVALLSARGVGKEPRYERAMFGAEEALKRSSLSWTMLRPNNFNQNFDEDFWLAPIQSGRMAFPIGDVTEPFIDSEDIAAVAATVLTEDGHDSKSYELSGPEALTFTEAAAEIAKASGRTIVFEDLSPEAFERELADQDWPQEGIDEFSGFFTYLRSGQDSPVTDGVRQVLGREPIRFGDYVRKVQEAGGWD